MQAKNKTLASHSKANIEMEEYESDGNPYNDDF
jgi:hypothetical protein